MINRRDFLKLSGLTATLTALAACQPLVSDEGANAQPTATAGPAAGLTPAPQDEDWLLRRTLHRITFGPHADEVERARQIGLETFIEEQLAPDSLDDPHLPDVIESYSTLTADPAEFFNVEPRNLPVRELTAATLLRAVYSSRQLYELMVDFWTNHFNIYVAGGQLRIFKAQDDREVIRPHALGYFGDMLAASAKSPAMLLYLDNASSTKDRPNENYARELLELHTLGVDGGYTQLDVQEVARAFTGWTVGRLRSRNAGAFVFRQDLHDDEEKLVLGAQLPAGTGIVDGEAILEMLVDHPSTAEFVSAKLVRRFVADDPPASLVASAAEAFRSSGGHIPSVMKAILLSDEFNASLGNKLKRPLEVFVSTLHLTEAQVSPERNLNGFLALMGQPLFQWPTPDGYPDQAEAWSNTSGMLARWNYALALGYGALRGTQVDWVALSGNAASDGEILDSLGLALVGQTLPEEARHIILNFVSGIPSDLKHATIGTLILASPYFQFR